VPERLREIIEKQPNVRFDRAHLKTLDQAFIEFEIVYIMLDSNYNLFMDTQQNILLEAMQMFEDLGISTAPRPQPLLLQEPHETARDNANAEPLPGATALRPRYKGV